MSKIAPTASGSGYHFVGVCVQAASSLPASEWAIGVSHPSRVKNEESTHDTKVNPSG